jgi:hypothetical protein
MIFRCNHYEKVNIALESLPVTKNTARHEETDIEWLKNELRQAKVVVDQVLEWIDKCKCAIN